MSRETSDLLLKDYKPVRLLKRSDNTPERAKFPVIDAHNHLFGDLPAAEMLAVMDAVGVRTFVNVTGNVGMPLVGNCYTIQRREFDVFKRDYIEAHPGRFAALTMSKFAQWGDFTLSLPPSLGSRDGSSPPPELGGRGGSSPPPELGGRGGHDGFVDRAIQTLEADVAKGALGLKVTKELGLQFRDASGAMIAVDDERLSPIWQRAGDLGVPVLIHVSDPRGFFLPVDERNEHYLNLHEFPGWSFHGSHFSKDELLEQRNRMIAAHPKTTFFLPHVANDPEDLGSISALLDRFPNVVIDFSARIDELGRQPYSARDFLIAYQDRTLFGSDMPLSVEMYRCYFRFLETRDECFEYMDYIGRWGHSRWGIYGLYLPDEVLRKIYYGNAIRLMPALDVE